MPPAQLERLNRARLELVAIVELNPPTDFYKHINSLADEIEQLIIRNSNRDSSETSQGTTVKS